jgi:hypothetical protein
MKNSSNAPGLVGVAGGVVALVMGLFALATGHAVPGLVAVILAAVTAAAGMAWLLHTHRQVRDTELQWHEAYSEEPAPPPSS